MSTEHGAQKWKVVGGIQQIASRICDDITHWGHATARFNSVVSSVEFNSFTGLTTVTCRDGFKATAKHVVVSVAPQLAIRSIEFIPSLPRDQTKLFTSIIGGHAVKIIMVFRRAFWLRQRHEDYNPNRTNTMQQIPAGLDLLDINVCSTSFPSIQPFRTDRHFAELGFMHNIFHGEVCGFPALIGLITVGNLNIGNCSDEQERELKLCNLKGKLSKEAW